MKPADLSEIKMRKHLKGKINKLTTNSMIKNIGDLCSGINEFTRGYQPRSNLVKYENGDLLADSNNILNRRKNYFPQLLNVHNISDFRLIEVHSAEQFDRGSSPLVVEIAIAKSIHHHVVIKFQQN
jgi:hypothetical protein